jgi:hypothetical protein
VQKKCFCVLNYIQRNKDDQTKLEDQMEGMRDKYQKARDAFDIIVYWKSVYSNPPSTLPLYTTKQKIKYQVLFDTWKPLLEDIKRIQKTVTKTYKRLWNAYDELLEEFGMDIMPNIDDVSPSEVRIEEVDERRDFNQDIIEPDCRGYQRSLK